MNDLRNYKQVRIGRLKSEILISEGQSTYAHNMVKVWKSGTSANMNLILRNNNSSQEALRVLKLALKYEITEVVSFLSKQLLKYYTYQGRKSEVKKIQNIVRESQLLLNAETDVEFFLMDIDKDIISKLSDEKTNEKLNKYIKKVDEIINRFNSLNFILGAYTIKIRKAQLDNDVNEIIRLCDEAMSRLDEKNFELPHVVYLAFTFLSIPLQIENNNFEDAENLIESIYSKLTRKTMNWFIINSYNIILNFRKLDFERVGQLLSQVKRYDNEINRERNKIYEAYLSLFTKQQFKLGKFSNEVFEHYKDRQGYRINIIILQLLHLLKYRKHGVFIDRVEAIEKYLQRYLKSTSRKLLRSRYFLKCLLVIPKSNFNKIAFKRKSAPYYEKLIATKRADTNQLLEQEPITYEYLYFFVEGLLK